MKTSDFELVPQTDMSLRLLFIDGLGRVGKSMFSDILPAFTGMEHIQVSTGFEMIIAGSIWEK